MPPATFGTGTYSTNPVPAVAISSPVAAQVLVGSTPAPETANAAAMTISHVSNGAVEDGVGSLTVHAVRAGNAVPGRPTTAASFYALGI